MTDERSLHALDVAEAYAENRWLVDDADYAAAWEDELNAARAAAAATDVAADAAAWAAVRAVARVAAWAAATAAATAAAEAAAQAAQERKLREMLIAGIETGDTK
jgi:hypothetical protein